MGDIHVAGFYERPHLSVEEGEEERTDVCAVDVSVGHDYDLVIACVLQLAVLHAHSGPNRSYHCADFRVRQDFVDARFLDIEDLTAQR